MVQTAHLGEPPRSVAHGTSSGNDVFVGPLRWVHDPSLDLSVLLRNAHIRDTHTLINTSNFTCDGRGSAHTVCGRIVAFADDLAMLSSEDIETRLSGGSGGGAFRHVTLKQALSCMADGNHALKVHRRSPILVLGSPIRHEAVVFGQMIERLESGLCVGIVDITAGVKVAHRRVLVTHVV